MKKFRWTDEASSSFLPETNTFDAFVNASLHALLHQNPSVYAAMCQSLAGRVAHLTVDASELRLSFHPNGIATCGAAPHRSEPQAAARVKEPTVVASTTTSCIRAVLRATLTIRQAILRGLLDLRGEPSELARFDRALDLYIRGAIRSPAFDDLLALYLS